MVLKIIGWFLIVAGVIYGIESAIAKNWGSLIFAIIVGLGLGIFLVDRSGKRKHHE